MDIKAATLSFATLPIYNFDDHQANGFPSVVNEYAALIKAADTPWVDVVLARINPRGSHMDGTTEQITATLRRIKQAGKAVIGMKIFGEGDLVNMKDECIRFAQGLGLLDAMTIGFQAPNQIDEVLRLIARHPAAPLVNS